MCPICLYDNERRVESSWLPCHAEPGSSRQERHAAVAIRNFVPLGGPHDAELISRPYGMEKSEGGEEQGLWLGRRLLFAYTALGQRCRGKRRVSSRHHE